MIHVERSRVSLPVDVAQRLKVDQGRLINFYTHAAGGSKAYQQRAFNYNGLAATRSTLLELFANKCAYCETSLLGQPGDIENFRPKSTIQELDGKVIREGYWWLAHEWDNLYIACASCNRLYKKNKFPIRGKRAKPGTTGRQLRAEKPLLLDPCDDYPSRLLWFTADGMVQSVAATRSRHSGPGSDPLEPGAVTIEVLGLNRKDLVEERRRLFITVTAALRHLRTGADTAMQAVLAQTQPYLGAIGQWIAADLSSPQGPVAPGWLRARLDELHIDRQVVRDLAKSESRGKATTKLPIKSRPKLVTVDALLSSVVEGQEYPAVLPEALVAHSVCIKHISLRNFKAIRRLDLNIPVVDTSPSMGDASPTPVDPASNVAPTSRAGWYVLLGENAVGKSSVLEAVALAVMGRSHLEKLLKEDRLALDKIVHLPPGADPRTNRRTCVIRLTLEPSELEIELRITRTSYRFVKGGMPLPTLIRGYGFVRLLPRHDEAADRSLSLARCDNLFDPRKPLSDAEGWMASLPYDETEESSFDIAATTILELLPKPDTVSQSSEDEEGGKPYLKPKDGKVVVMFKGRELALDQLSSGYQSVIAVAADIMSGMPADRLFDMKQAAGLVLLDEIGTQLHPRWRMHAIRDLRLAFPGIQFIATTHEPLCLKGVSRNEVAVLRREGEADDVMAITEGFQDPRALRADQLLTSPLFGLDSTIDPEVDRRFQQYYALLARKNDNESPTSRAERERLERELAPHRALGYTRSDQLVYALLDEYLAKEGAATKRKARAVSEPVRRQIYEIWRNVRSHREAGR